MTAPRLRDITAAAAELGVSVSWLEKAVARREVQHTRVGRLTKFSDADLDAFVATRTQPALTGATRLRSTA